MEGRNHGDRGEALFAQPVVPQCWIDRVGHQLDLPLQRTLRTATYSSPASSLVHGFSGILRCKADTLTSNVLCEVTPPPVQGVCPPMGCLMSKRSKHSEKENHNQTSRASLSALNGIHISSKEYSWSNREKTDLSRYVVQNVHGRAEIRFPGEIDGQQFLINNCKGATICLYDYTNTVIIEDCTECTFFVGPVKNSISVRNCADCRILSASQQFRTRDCKRLDLFLFCATQPAIESCSQLRFGCFSGNYSGLKDQFAKANLNVYNNKWSQVYDFSIDDQERHWSTFPSDVKANDLFRTALLASPVLNLSFDSATSLVPQTMGVTSLEFLHHHSTDFYPNSSASFESTNLAAVSVDESTRLCLIFLYGFDEGNCIDLAVERLLQEVTIKHKDFTLLMTKSFQPDQISLKLSLITEEDNNGLRGEERNKEAGEVSASGKSPNRLLALFYQGNESIHVLCDICKSMFGSPQSSIHFKLINDDSEESNFAHYLSIAFENLISSY